jgi:ElaB/YqjD/DUF883 family membrane-anchored ribosome-binding protein
MGTQRGATTRTESSAEVGGSTRIQEAASGLIDQAGSTADAQASRTMTQAGDSLQQIARAIREAGKGIRDEQPQLAGFADTAADQVERSATYLRNHDAIEVLNAASDFARRQPAMVVGGGLLIGLTLGRFLRTASESAADEFGSGMTSGYGRYGSTTYRTRYDTPSLTAGTAASTPTAGRRETTPNSASARATSSQTGGS